MGKELGICRWWSVRLGKKPCSGAAPAAARPASPCGLGSLVFVIILPVILSGLYMALFFQPSPAEAWNSVRFIEEDVYLGFFARALHRWGAFAALLAVILHIFGALWRGAYRAPRELNWLSGLLLFLLVAAFIVTGYLLPWDFRAYWVVKTISNWLGDLPLFSGLFQWLFYTDVPNGSVPVGRWFAVHAVLLPLLTGLILAVHYTLFRRHGAAGEKR
jgi:quinol-cytochrome oxidoreductase complex cytochrome b subunit